MHTQLNVLGVCKQIAIFERIYLHLNVVFSIKNFFPVRKKPQRARQNGSVLNIKRNRMTTLHYTPLTSDCAIIRPIAQRRSLSRFTFWTLRLRLANSTDTMIRMESLRACVKLATSRGTRDARRVRGSGGSNVVLRGDSHCYRSPRGPIYPLAGRFFRRGVC